MTVKKKARGGDNKRRILPGRNGNLMDPKQQQNRLSQAHFLSSIRVGAALASVAAVVVAILCTKGSTTSSSSSSIPAKNTVPSQHSGTAADHHRAALVTVGGIPVPNLLPPGGAGPVSPDVADILASGPMPPWLVPPPPPAPPAANDGRDTRQTRNPPPEEGGGRRRNFTGSALERSFRSIESREGRWDAACVLSSMTIVPIYSRKGYEVVPIPEDIYRVIRSSFDARIGDATPDKYDRYGIEPLTADGAWKSSNGIVYREPHKPLYVTQPFEEAKAVVDVIKPLAERFAGGVPLSVTAHHGFRLYPRHSHMHFHTDRVFSHAIGANIHVRHQYDDDPDNDDDAYYWPFEIYNHETGEIDSLDLKEGEMLLYEAVGNMHARPQPLRGDFYASVFIHFAPESGWPFTVQDVVDAVDPRWDDPVRSEEEESGGGGGTRGDRSGETWYSVGQGRLIREQRLIDLGNRDSFDQWGRKVGR